jgi:hypothetical protein
MVSYAASMQGANYDLFSKRGEDKPKESKADKPKGEKKGGFLSRIKAKISDSGDKGGSSGGSGEGKGDAGGGNGECCIFNEAGGGGCGPCNKSSSMSRIMFSNFYGLT